MHDAAAYGVSGSGGALPHAATLQRAFGHHDLSGARAHVGGAAAEGARAIGAEAYATGSHMAFASQPDLHTAAHEAAHIVQQRAGVQLKGGIGQVGDPYERHADQVADLVVQGKRADALLDRVTGGSPKASGASGGAVQRRSSEEVHYVTLPKGTEYFTDPHASCVTHKLAEEISLLPTGEGFSHQQHGALKELTSTGPRLRPVRGYFKASALKGAEALRVKQAMRTAGPLINRWVCMTGMNPIAVSGDDKRSTTLSWTHKLWISGFDPHTRPPTLRISRIQHLGEGPKSVNYSTNAPLSRFTALHTPAELMQSRYFDAYPYERYLVTRSIWPTWSGSGQRGKRLAEHPPNIKASPAMLHALGLSPSDWTNGKVAMSAKDAGKAKHLVKDLSTMRSMSELSKRGGPTISSLVQNEVKAALELRFNIPLANYQLVSGNLMFALNMELERSKASGGKSEWKAKVDLRGGVLGKLDAHFVKAFIRAFAAGFVEVKGDSPVELLNLIVLGARRVAASAGVPSWFLAAIMDEGTKARVVKEMDSDGSDYVKAGAGLGVAGGGELQNPADRSAIAGGQASYRRNWTKTMVKGKDGKLKTKDGKSSTLAFKYFDGDWGVELKIVKSASGAQALTLKEVEFSLERGVDLSQGPAATLQMLAGVASVAAAALRKHPALGIIPAALITSGCQGLATKAAVKINAKYSAALAKLKRPGGAATRNHQPLELAVKLVGKYDARGRSMELAFVNAASVKMSVTSSGTQEYGGGARKNDPFYIALELEHTLAKTTLSLNSKRR